MHNLVIQANWGFSGLVTNIGVDKILDEIVAEVTRLLGLGLVCQV